MPGARSAARGSSSSGWPTRRTSTTPASRRTALGRRAARRRRAERRPGRAERPADLALARLLVLGAGYVGARLAELALDRGDEVVLADNWYATDRAQLAGLEARGALVESADIRVENDVGRLLSAEPDRLFLVAAQASRPLSEREPDYTEETNATGVRLVAQAVAARAGPPVVFGSSLHVYGPGLAGEVGADRP